VSDTQVTALLGRAAVLLAGTQPGAGADEPTRSVPNGQLRTLRAGVDLGTATCVLAVLDPVGQPVYVASHPSGALRDGVVVDFAAAQRTVGTLRQDAERVLGTTLTSASTAYPPCIAEADARACRFVCEAAGFDKVTLTDEVTAAQQVLGLADGVVVDVGGGSTGVGIFRSGQRVALADRPGGGHHLDLVLAGALGITTEAAERRKREHPRSALPHLVPGLERIAESVRLMTAGAEDLPVHIAGGALMIPGAAEVVARYLGRETVSYPHALLITPLGIALCSP
jgi:ethanolamine utilization protein EutJ